MKSRLPDAPDAPDVMRQRALRAMGFAVVLAIAAWFGLSRAADIGQARLSAYDRVRAVCETKYAASNNVNDSVLVDESTLSEVLDNGVDGAPRRCVDLKKPGVPARR